MGVCVCGCAKFGFDDGEDFGGALAEEEAGGAVGTCLGGMCVCVIL